MKIYIKFLKKNDLSFFAGVPDSTFNDWMKFLNDKHGEGLTNIIATNECEASAIASGYYLKTGKTGIVYMQNSGLGKTVNPTTSLLSKEVYSIPTIYMIGWRGEPNKKDEPQHKKMGRAMLPLNGPNMIIVRVNNGSRKDLGRPTTIPIENKKAFMNFLNK